VWFGSPRILVVPGGCGGDRMNGYQVRLYSSTGEYLGRCSWVDLEPARRFARDVIGTVIATDSRTVAQTRVYVQCGSILSAVPE